MRSSLRLVFSTLLMAVATTHFANAQEEAVSCPLQEPILTSTIWDAVAGSGNTRQVALDKIVQCDEKSAIGPIILGLRHIVSDNEALTALSTLAGAPIGDWHNAMLWQEAHPEVKSHPAIQLMKLRIFERIDPRFMQFLGGTKSSPENMKIRLEEITWGGVVVDGIPALNYPKLIEADDAEYLDDDSLVFGVSINGDARAYPLRIMGWHEMFNETIGGVPVALAYCTLCGAGILYETQVEGREKELVFGSSGFLYRSNKLMFDRETNSLWNQFTGEPVTGPLVDSGIKLKTRPLAITRWGDWKEKNPTTRVLDLRTGFLRNYDEGVVYNNYFSSDELMFPVLVDEENLKAKDYIFGIRDVAQQKAWPLKAFKEEPVINDALGAQNLVLIGNPDNRTVRAYDRGELRFSGSEDALTAAGQNWQVTEEAIVADDGTRLARVPGHVAYWFGWNSYFGVKSEVYSR